MLKYYYCYYCPVVSPSGNISLSDQKVPSSIPRSFLGYFSSDLFYCVYGLGALAFCPSDDPELVSATANALC